MNFVYINHDNQFSMFSILWSSTRPFYISTRTVFLGYTSLFSWSLMEAIKG